jgi:hypothetical protein
MAECPAASRVLVKGFVALGQKIVPELNEQLPLGPQPPHDVHVQQEVEYDDPEHPPVVLVDDVDRQAEVASRHDYSVRMPLVFADLVDRQHAHNRHQEGIEGHIKTESRKTNLSEKIVIQTEKLASSKIKY